MQEIEKVSTWDRDKYDRAVSNPSALTAEAVLEVLKFWERKRSASPPQRYTFRPNFFSNSTSEIWIIVGRPCGQQ
jgi:hypothetical protein